MIIQMQLFYMLFLLLFQKSPHKNSIPNYPVFPLGITSVFPRPGEIVPLSFAFVVAKMGLAHYIIIPSLLQCLFATHTVLQQRSGLSRISPK